MGHADRAGEEPHQRHAGETAALLKAVLESEGAADKALREAAYRREAVPPQLQQYVAKIHGESYRMTDREIQGLVAAGYSQDMVFEITTAAALGAAYRRLEAGLRLLREGR